MPSAARADADKAIATDPPLAQQVQSRLCANATPFYPPSAFGGGFLTEGASLQNLKPVSKEGQPKSPEMFPSSHGVPIVSPHHMGHQASQHHGLHPGGMPISTSVPYASHSLTTTSPHHTILPTAHSRLAPHSAFNGAGKFDSIDLPTTRGPPPAAPPSPRATRSRACLCTASTSLLLYRRPSLLPRPPSRRLQRGSLHQT